MKTSVGLPLAAISVMLLACIDGQPAAPPRVEAVVSAQPKQHKEQEEVFAEVASRLPGFGGFYFDSAGDMVAILTDSAQATKAKEVLAPFAKHHGNARGGSGTAPIKIRTGRFGFSQLEEWRNLAADLLRGAPGVVWIDLDEAHNRITVGVDRRNPTAGRAATADVARRLGAPDGAFDVEESAPAHADLGPLGEMGVDFPNDIFRPIKGGIKFNWLRSDGLWTFCTLAFTAYYGGTRVAITNTHCSNSWEALDYTLYAQSGFYGPDGHLVGREWSDPQGWRCGFLWTDRCRESDANMVAVADSIPMTPAIVEPNGWAPYGQRIQGPKQVDPTNPELPIGSTEHGVYTGDMLDKVGVTMAWTYGFVQRTCIEQLDPPYHNKHLECNHYTDYWSEGGDSGSPVFRYNGNGQPVVLYGIHWGRTDDLTYAIYSGYRSIEYDWGVTDQGILRPVY